MPTVVLHFTRKVDHKIRSFCVWCNQQNKYRAHRNSAVEIVCDFLKKQWIHLFKHLNILKLRVYEMDMKMQLQRLFKHHKKESPLNIFKNYFLP